jgi:hypothetical protein
VLFFFHVLTFSSPTAALGTAKAHFFSFLYAESHPWRRSCRFFLFSPALSLPLCFPAVFLPPILSCHVFPLHINMSWAVLLQHNNVSSTSPPTPPHNPLSSAALRWLIVALATRASSAFACGLGAISRPKSAPLECVCVTWHRKEDVARTIVWHGGFPGHTTK